MTARPEQGRGEPLHLTGSHIQAVRDDEGDVLITLDIPAALTRDIAWQAAHYDLQATNANGRVKTLCPRPPVDCRGHHPMSEILITQEPSAPIDIDADSRPRAHRHQPARSLLPYIGANGHWWVAGTDSDQPARGEPGEKGSDGQPGASGQTAKMARRYKWQRRCTRRTRYKRPKRRPRHRGRHPSRRRASRHHDAAAAKKPPKQPKNYQKMPWPKPSAPRKRWPIYPPPSPAAHPRAKPAALISHASTSHVAFRVNADVVPGIQDFAGTWRVVAIRRAHARVCGFDNQLLACGQNITPYCRGPVGRLMI